MKAGGKEQEASAGSEQLGPQPVGFMRSCSDFTGVFPGSLWDVGPLTTVEEGEKKSPDPGVFHHRCPLPRILMEKAEATLGEVQGYE